MDTFNKDMEKTLAKRKRQDHRIAEEMQKNPQFAVTPSPDVLDTLPSSPGQDLTGTMGDFAKVIKWVEERGFNTLLYKDAIEQAEKGEVLQDSVFYSLIRRAFHHVFEPIRGTSKSNAEELVFWYYAGHGLGPTHATRFTESGYIPGGPFQFLGIHPNYFNSATKFFKTLQVEPPASLNGGELCLHEVGYPGLYWLLKPWISALKTNPPKENKHLVLVLDSCYSGQLAQQLREWVSINEDLWKENGCSVTVQAACGPGESTFGGYFTPGFVYLNQNERKLEEKKEEWNRMTEEEKNYYEQVQLPSPQVVATKWSTGEDNTDLTTEFTIQGFKMTLFHDAAFFKFCFLNVFQGVDQPLTEDEANQFLRQPEFDVLDYKLKTTTTTDNAGHQVVTPLGLFLLKDPQNDNRSFCVHVYFKLGDAGKPDSEERIDLVHHEFRNGTIFYLEEANAAKKALSIDDTRVLPLLDSCRSYVESSEAGRWSKVSQWNMKYSAKNKSRKDQRDEWIKKYTEQKLTGNKPIEEKSTP